MTPRVTLRANQIAGLAAAIAEIRPLAHPADALLHQFFRRHKAMGQHDRAFIADGVFAYLRRRRSLEELAQTQRPMHLALAVLVRELGIGVREWERVLSADDVLWLRAFKSRLATPLPPAVAADLPDWLWERLGAAYGDAERAALAQAWLSPAPLDLRVNPLKTTRDDARAALAASGIAAEPTPYSPLGLRIAGRPALARHPLFVAGALEVQDEGSQLVGLLVAPKRSDMVVDFCAGAGGKTLLLGALMRSQGRLYAFDTHRPAPREPEAAARALRTVQRASATAGARARHEGQASRRQDRSRAGRRAVHRIRHAAAQSRSQVAPAGVGARRARGQAAGDPRRRGDAGEARRPSRLRDLQRAARRERSGRRRIPRGAIPRSRAAMRRPSSRAPASRSTRARRCSSSRTGTAATASTPRCSRELPDA